MIYLKATSCISGNYTTPEIFTYKASGANAEDIALRGIWVEQANNLGDVSAKLNLEENGYGLIANIKAEYIKLDTDFVNSINSTNETGIKNIENNKIILKVVDEKLTEPIMAELSAKGKKVTIKITKTDNGIKEVRNENGELAEKISDTEFLYTVENGGLNKFIIIDNIGNQKLVEILVIVPEIYVITNQENFIEFNGEKWYPYNTKVRIKYMDSMTKMKGYYKQINGTVPTAVEWTDNSTNTYKDFTISETFTFKAKIENSIGEILGEDEATIHIMPRDTSIPDSYYNNNVGGIYPVQVKGAIASSQGGDETYPYTTYIQNAAVHMGLIKPNETKVLYIKIVPSPQGGYTGSARNGVSTAYDSLNNNGYIFVTEDGAEIKLPTIDNVSQKQEDNKLTVTVDAKSYNSDKTISKYYYSIDSTNLSDYIESDSNEYVFNDVQAYKNHTIRVYVKDSYGITSNISEITTRTGNTIPTPTIEIVNEDTLDSIEYDGKTWYPYGTQIRINYAEDMTNLTGQRKTINEITKVESGWNNTNSATYQTSVNETTTYVAKLINSLGEETEEVKFTIYIMPYTQGTMQQNYYNNLGAIYPVRVKGAKSGNIYGTDTYMYQSYIQHSAIHMGLLGISETKDLFIKIVPSPAGGYRSTTKNGITTSQDNSNYNGYIFVTKDGEEIRSPIIESTVLTGGENTITATVSATANIGTIEKYYYSIDNGAFIESYSNIYEFTDIEAYKSHEIKVYVKNSYGVISDTITLTGKTRNTIPTPTIEIVNKDTLDSIEYDGKVWYPYNTQIKITYAEDMTNLTGQVKTINETTGVESGWNNIASATYQPGVNESQTIVAKLKDSTGVESEEVSIHLNIMAYESSLQSNYYRYGLNKIYPVRVKSSTGDNTIWGTNTYSGGSRIKTAAVHMGLLTVNETKDLFIKIVEIPEGGYKSSTRNGITSTDGSSTQGYIFVTKDGKEIKSPTLNNLTAIGGENSITATLEVNCTNSEPQEYYYAIIDETTYKKNTSSDKDYYKKNPTALTFNKSEEKTYQFTVEPYKNYVIIAYAKDSNGATSEFYNVVGKASNEVPKPKIEIVDKDTLETVEYDGKTWYPYGTQIKITYADSLTNLTPYCNWHPTRTNFSGWVEDSNTSITTTLSEPSRIYAKNVDSTGEEAEEELTVYIMPGDTLLNSTFANYYLGQMFPVIVTGNTSGSIYGTEVYRYNSYIAKAAMQMGLVQEGEKKQLFIKVVENPNEYYKAVSANGITSSESLSTDKGYIFVDKNGNEIKHSASTQTGDITISIPADAKYYEYDGKKHYEQGTQVTINYTGSGTNYYASKTNNGTFSKWNNIGTNSSYTLTLTDSTTILTKIEDAHGNVIAKKLFELNVMNSSTSSTLSNRTIGDLVLMQVTGTNSGGTVWGTDIYTADSLVAKAATHAGIVSVGETKQIFAKVIEGQSSYSGTVRNGISTNSYGTYPKSYIFVNENEIKVGSGGNITGTTQIEEDKDITISVPEGTAYVEYKGEKWYPSGTTVTINYTGTGTKTHYYGYRNEITESTYGWYSNNTTATWSTTITESTIFFAKITNELGDIATEKSMKINIMPLNTGMNSNYNIANVIGKIFPVEVTYSTTGNCYGTNIYRYNSNINKAASHMGLVKAGETKTLYIKIVNSPATGYIGTMKNGITTQTTSGYNGFVFVDENGNEIMDNNYVSGEVGATLSGYNVINNNTNTVNNNVYTFINDGTSIIPTNSKISTGRNEWITANSYVEIDLTDNTNELYTLTLNAEISAHNSNLGYATITEDTKAPQYTETNGRIVSISGQKMAQDYTTTLLGGKKYYLHLGYHKHTGYNTYEDLIRFNSLKVEKLSDLQKPTITVDPSVTPVEYKGELWYPYYTQVTINYDENYDKRYCKYEYEDGTPSTLGTSSNVSATITCVRPMTINAGHTIECSEASLKINIMPHQNTTSMDKAFYEDVGAIYPVQVTGQTGGTIYGTAKYLCDSIIETAATHMGLVKPNETKTVYIKIIEFPQGGYKGSRMNNITSRDYATVKNGYVFVDENGEEILEPILHSNATLSGYSVYPNGGYYFEQLGDSISCSSYYNSTDVGSYIELDLSNYTKEDMFKVNLNMEVSGYYYGCASITKTKDQTSYSNSTGRFINVSGTKESKNYGTIIPGGEKYYLHLISYRYNSNSNGENQVKFNSLEVTQIPVDKKPTIIIDASAEPVTYKGELWYPYGTKVTISYIEEDCNYTDIGIDNKKYLWYKLKYEISDNEYSYTTNNGNYSTTLSQSTTFWAKYGENSPEEMIKINVMPNDTYVGAYNDDLDSVYPIRITGNRNGGYGNNTYAWIYVIGRVTYYPAISSAATHMGLVENGETKVVYVKMVPSPAGGYVSVRKNEINSSDAPNNISNGFIFVTEEGIEILEPIINSATAVIGSENTIVATVNAVGQNGTKVEKYYYSIDNGEYIETTDNTYTFTDIDAHKTHTVKIYVRDEHGAVSQTKEVVTSVVTNNVMPTITLDENVTPIEYNGELWYPYGTKLTINYAEDMTNLTAYYAFIDERTGNQGSWQNHSSNKTYTTTLNYSVTYMAKIVDKSGNETDVAKKTIRIMPDGANGANYYSSYIGNVYPVRVTGTTSGNAYGEDVYMYSSNVSKSATHMGLVNIDETKVVLIKIVPAPVGGYKGTLRNGIQTSNYSYTYNGFVFIDEDGNEITRPKINSVVTTSGDNSITVTVNAQSDNATIEKYYYSIDNGEYVETTNNIYTFNEITTSGNHIIKVYVKNSNNNISSIKEFYGYRNTPTPTITFNQEPIIYNGEKWYPYGTRMYINFSRTDTGYYRSVNVHSTSSIGAWYTTSSWPYSIDLAESVIYEVYNYNGISGESEHIREKINIMAYPDSLQSSYYNYGSGNVYPVTVTGTTGSGYGTDIYCAYSRNYTPIGVAAVHSGLLEVGETKTLYIKIVPSPEGGYKGSTRNGIKTNNLNSTYKGYTFVQ